MGGHNENALIKDEKSGLTVSDANCFFQATIMEISLMNHFKLVSLAMAFAVLGLGAIHVT